MTEKWGEIQGKLRSVRVIRELSYPTSNYHGSSVLVF